MAMVARVLPFFIFWGTFFVSVSGSPVGLDKFLNDALGRIDVPFSLQNVSLPVPGLGAASMDLSGRCRSIALEDIDTHNTDFNLALNVSGLNVSCDIDAALTVTGLLIELDIDFNLQRGWVKFPISVPPFAPDPSDPSLLLPERVMVNVDECAGSLPGNHSITLPHLPIIVRPFKNAIIGGIEGIITDPGTFCAVVEEVLKKVGNTTILGLDAVLVEDIQEARNDKGLNETTYSDPNGDIANISNNIGTTYVKTLLDTLGNPENPESINHVLEENHGASVFLGVDNDPTARLGKPLFPVPLEFLVSGWTVGLNLTGFEINGLDTFSKLAFQTPGPSLNLVDFALGLDDLKVKVNLSAKVTKPDAPDELVERFTLDLGLKKFAVGLSGFWHFNGTTADEFTFGQLPHLGCLSQTVNSTQAGMTHGSLSIGELELAITPAGTPDPLERGLDDTVYALTQLIFHQYADSIDEEANWALSIYARHLINAKLTEYLARPVTDDKNKSTSENRLCAPPKPAYQSKFLHQAGLWGSVAASVIGAVLVLTAAFSNKRNKVKQTPPRGDAPDTASPLTEGAQDPPLDDADDFGDNVSLARNPKLPLGLRAGLPIFVFANAILFISSNAGSGASIYLTLQAGGQNLFPALPPAFDFSLVNTIVEMAQGKVWLLVFVIGFFSGVWPYVKLFMMLACWFLPANKLSVGRRHKVLEFLDAFGKWSLVDTYVLVLFVVAFSINLECGDAAGNAFREVCNAAQVGSAVFKLYVLPTIGFHTFLIATLMSLVNGLAMSTCHRYAHRIGEFGPAEEYERIEGLGNKRRLCSVLKDNSKFTAVGVTVGLMISMVLAVLGVFMTTFEFVFQGIVGLAMGPESATRAYSLFGLGEELPAASINPNTFGIHWIQFFFIVFSGVTVLIFLGLLLVLWNVPLTVKGQRTFLVLAQIMNAWSGLDVFVVAILACCLEITQFAEFIMGDTGVDALNPYIPVLMSFFPMWNDMMGCLSNPDPKDGFCSVFHLSTHLKPGFWLLAIAAILSTGIGQITLNKCSKSLFDANHQPLETSIAASFTNTGTSTGP